MCISVASFRRDTLKDIIKEYDEIMIWACISDGLGLVYADNIENPKSAQFIIGDFCFFVGKPNLNLAKNTKDIKSGFSIMTSNNQEWNKLIEECYKDNYKKIKRYAIKKEKNIFDIKKLESIATNLDKKYEAKFIDDDLYFKVLENEWSKDFCSNFESKDDYAKRGLGVVILHNDKVVAGASSYIGYSKGIEIEVDTKEEYRRRGLASVASARLILECLNRGVYPSWDAANMTSVKLAEKLGYHFDHEYVAYEVSF